MIGNEFWDRSIFGTMMVVIGGLFTWLIWGKSIIMVLVGISTMLFGAYVIWGAFAWEAYRRKVQEKYTRDPKHGSSSQPQEP